MHSHPIIRKIHTIVIQKVDWLHTTNRLETQAITTLSASKENIQ